MIKVLYLWILLGVASALTLRGASEKDTLRLKLAGDKFRCKDGSMTHLQTRLNDNYCDCADGSDEPGTNACSNGQFYCKNQGFFAKYIFSSRVEDGICDCCDGSDEASAKCVNTCQTLSVAWAQQTESENNKIREGLRLKEQNIHNAKNDLQTKSARNAQIEQELDLLNKEKQQFEEQKAKLDESAKIEEENDEDDDEDVENEEKEDEEQEPDSVAKTVSGFIGSVLSPILSKTDEKETLQNKISELSSKISALEKERNDNQQALSGDFGVNNEFYYLRGSCFRSETQEYTYEVCPFDKVNQISKTGGSHTLLGKWEDGDSWKSNRSTMNYKNGLRCWGGPDRSIKVNLRCGTDTRAEHVSEPNRCEYQMDLVTPAACEQSLLNRAVPAGHIHDEL